MKNFLKVLLVSFLITGCNQEELDSNLKRSPETRTRALVQPVVSTYAGVTTPSLYIQNAGYNNGNPATFTFPIAIATSADGTAYVFDSYVPVIRQITTAGWTSKFSGSSAFVSPSYTGWGYADGTSTLARYNNPQGLCIGANGNIYMADTYNKRIREIDLTGAATTVAGDGTTGYLDGVGTSAQFKSPNSICSDNVGNLYIADEHRVRKIDVAGNVTTLSGSILAGNITGTLATARYRNITGIAFTPGVIYVSDSGNALVKKLDLNLGTVTTVTISGLVEPSGMVFSNGNLYVADRLGNVIYQVSSTGISSVFAGTGQGSFKDGLASIAKFYQPEQLSVDGQGNIYVADRNNQRIRKITIN